ncbi:MAG: hypothetical protein H0V44_15805 [Planctomycetes bacterium]|nr:hypothetical protein [Planctomycetota bacterium]
MAGPLHEAYLLIEWQQHGAHHHQHRLQRGWHLAEAHVRIVAGDANERAIPPQLTATGHAFEHDGPGIARVLEWYLQRPHDP